MTLPKILGIVLIAAGALGLIVGSVSYTRETHNAQLGPIVLKVEEQRTVLIPVVLSLASIAIGGVLLVVGLRRK
jgi:hypothetical protein